MLRRVRRRHHDEGRCVRRNDGSVLRAELSGDEQAPPDREAVVVDTARFFQGLPLDELPVPPPTIVGIALPRKMCAVELAM